MKLDAYDIRSRYQPALLAVAPVAVAVIGFGLNEAAWVAALMGLALGVGLPFFLAGVVRSGGLRVQDRLYGNWNGPSTRRLLRHSGTEASAADRSRWHANLSRLSGLALPTADQELDDPVTADDTYDSVTAVAREATRGDAFPLVAVENRSYGYWRNMLALRPVGLTLSIVGAIVLLAVVALQAAGDGPGPNAGSIAAAAAELVLVAVWWFGPTEARVREAADKYARQLLNAVPSS